MLAPLRGKHGNWGRRALTTPVDIPEFDIQ
jgi:hypothetical protein